MENDKQFLIVQTSEATSVTTSPRLGRILMRPEVNEIAGSFGSEVKRTFVFVSIDVVPPLPKAKLPKLGEALVELAHSLDSSDPLPTYRIVPKLTDTKNT